MTGCLVRNGVRDNGSDPKDGIFVMNYKHRVSEALSNLGIDLSILASFRKQREVQRRL